MSGNIMMALIIVMIIFFSFIAAKKTASENRHYDEMQMKIRADGYRTGFMVTAVGLTALIFLMEGSGILNTVIEPSFGMLIVLMSGMVTFAVYCIMHEAFFSVDQQGKLYIFLCLAVCLADGAAFVSRLIDGSILDNGRITFESGNSLVFFIGFLIILTALLIRKMQSGKEGEE